MAIGTPVSIGNSGAAATGTSISFTTTGAVPSGGKIILVGFYYGTGGRTVNGSGGGLTWALDKEFAGVADTNYHLEVMSADAPSGLASGTSLSMTVSGTAVDVPMVCGCYCTGLATASYVDATGGGRVTTNSADWSEGTVTTTNADDLLLCGMTIDAGSRTLSTVTPLTALNSGFTNTGGPVSVATAYEVRASTVNTTYSGTWSSGSSLEKNSVWVAYKGSGGGGGGGTTVYNLSALGVG